MIESYGVERFRELYVRSSRGRTPEAVSALFLDVLGGSSQDVVLDHSTHSKQFSPAAGALACGSAPLVVWRGDSAVWYAEGSWESGGWCTLEGQNGFEWTTIELAADGRYAFECGGRPFGLMRCLTEPTDEDELPELPWQVTHDDSVGLVPESMALLGGEDGALELPAGTSEIWGTAPRRGL